MSTTTMAEITTAINQIPTKKQLLLQSFNTLQSQSPSSLTWAHLDSYFTSLHSSLQHKYALLQTLQTRPDQPVTLARPELISFCQDSDGLGLRNFVSALPDLVTILRELPEAYKYAPDASRMVLEAVEEFHEFRSGCLVMLEGWWNVVVTRGNVEVGGEVKSEAMEVAVEWDRKMGMGCGEGEVEDVLGFLLLVAGFGLVDGFSVDDVVDCFVVVARQRQAVELCRRMVPEDKWIDLVQKLINKDMHVTAVHFSIELQKTNEFPPVRLLEQRKLKSMWAIDEARVNVNDLHDSNEVMMKEIDTLKAIIECIDEHDLQSQYPKDSLVELVNKLQNELESRKEALVKKLNNGSGCPKQPERAPVCKNQLLSKPKKRKRNKLRPTDVAPTIQDDTLIKKPHLEESDLLPDRVDQDHDSPLGSSPTAPYADPIVSPYGLKGANICCIGDWMAAGAGDGFYAPQSNSTFANDNSNGWISD